MNSGCAIMAGTIGDGAVICAGSFMNKDVEPYGIYVGSPAEILEKDRS